MNYQQVLSERIAQHIELARNAREKRGVKSPGFKNNVAMARTTRAHLRNTNQYHK